MRQTSWLTLILMCMVALGLGMITGGLGPAIPNLAANTGSTRETAGAIYSALFIGALFAQIIAGPMTDRIGAKPVMLAGMGLLIAGTLGFTAANSFPMLFGLGLIAGLGHGTVDVAIHILIAATYPERRVMATNLANAFFGVGAVIAPAIASLTLLTLQSALPGVIAGALFIALPAPFIWRMAGIRATHEAATDENSRIYRAPLLWLFGVLILLYVGIENGVSGWTTTYAERSAILTLEQGALLTSGFWLMLTAGRILSTWFSRTMTAERIMLLSLVGSALGGVLLGVGVGSLALTTGAVLLLGLSFGPIFPTMISLVTIRFAAAPGRATSVVMALGSLGGASIPWLQGVVLENVGTHAMALYASVIASGMLVVLLISQQWQARKVKSKPA
jgi:fucose permease